MAAPIFPPRSSPKSPVAYPDPGMSTDWKTWAKLTRRAQAEEETKTLHRQYAPTIHLVQRFNTLGADPEFIIFWANFNPNWSPARYYKDHDGMVHIEGIVRNFFAVNTPIFILPVGFRPDALVRRETVKHNSFAVIEVRADGHVRLAFPSATLTQFMNINITFHPAAGPSTP